MSFGVKEWKTVQTVPPHAHPHVQFIYKEMIRRGIGLKRLGKMSGVTSKTIGNWKYTTSPNVHMLDKVLKSLGYALVIEELPCGESSTS